MPVSEADLAALSGKSCGLMPLRHGGGLWTVGMGPSEPGATSGGRPFGEPSRACPWWWSDCARAGDAAIAMLNKLATSPDGACCEDGGRTTLLRPPNCWCIA